MELQNYMLSKWFMKTYESGKRLGGFHCWRRLCRQKGDGEPLFTDTFRPQCAYGQLRNTENLQRLRRSATASLMPYRGLIAVPPFSFCCCLKRNFTTAQPLAACFSSPRVETVIIRLPVLSAYHRLALPGLDIPFVKILRFCSCMLYLSAYCLCPKTTSE